jgi:hypothetical protein
MFWTKALYLQYTKGNGSENGIRHLVSVLSVLWLHFCDHLPFEENPTLYLYKLEFPSPKDNLY